MGNTAGGSVESGHGHLELAGGPEFLLWQEDLPLRNMVMGMGEPKEEEELNVYMLLGRVRGRGPEGAEVPGRRTSLTISFFLQVPMPALTT